MICFAVFRKHLDNRDNGGGGRQHFGGSENFQRPTSSPAFQDEEKNPPFSGGFLPPRQRYKWKSSPYIQIILFEIDCAIFYTKLLELFFQFISWTNLVNSGKFMDNCWIPCQVMDDMKKVYSDLIIINLYSFSSKISGIDNLSSICQLLFSLRHESGYWMFPHG